jgi:acetylornithine/N-succinyldiaminopimelate aminotransferase
MPIGALVIGERLQDVFEPGDHGSTFAGGPVAAAAANAVLDVVDDPAFLGMVRERGARLASALEALDGVESVRGAGLMVACEVAGGAPELARRALFEQRLVINATGPTTLRFLPPLIVSDDEIDDAVARVGALIASA